MAYGKKKNKSACNGDGEYAEENEEYQLARKKKMQPKDSAAISRTPLGVAQLFQESEKREYEKKMPKVKPSRKGN